MLGARVGVGDDAGPRLEVRHAAVEDDRADGDAGVEDAAGEAVPDRAGVRSSAATLQLCDQLHRPHLRCPGDGARREAGTQQVERPDPFAELSRAFPPSVTITRTSEEDCQARQLIVSIDGVRVAELLWGDSVRCDLQPGPHRLRVHNTLVWKNVDFTLAAGEQAFFEVINRATTSTYLVVALLGVGPLYVRVRRM